MTAIDTEDPLAIAAVEAIHSGDLPELKRLLARNPDLAAAGLGDDDPDGVSLAACAPAINADPITASRPPESVIQV